ncbi:MAG: DivIVA domain-containing protein [Ruminococcaceae bacterium]|nr:DivIVA domain-containing protein [Oscillospiraceae bacterium]
MLPPNKINNKEFSRVIRGYNPQEVDAHLNDVMQNYSELYTRVSELEKAYDELYKKYKVLELDKDMVKNDLKDAMTASEKIISEAQEKSDIIVRATKTNCDYIIADYRRTVAAEREKLLNVQARIQSMKEVLLAECREYMEAIDRMTEISDTSLYYEDDDEMVAKVMNEVKTDVRYAMAEKEQLDTISDEDAKVDLECFNEAVNEEENSNTADPEFQEDKQEKSSEIELAKTVVVPDTSKIGDKYIEFLEELTNDNSDTDKE